MTQDRRIIEFPKAARAPLAGRLLIPDRLRDARKAARLTQTDLATRINVSKQAVSAYERGDKVPEAATFRKIVEVLGQPAGYFTAEDRDVFGRYSTRFFRKTGPDTERRNQASAILGHWFVQTAHYFDAFVNYPPVNIPEAHPKGEAYSDEEIEDIAASTRKHWGLGVGPISNVLALLESKGVTTCRYAIENESIDAYSFWNGPRPFIFMAAEKESGARVRYDLAHELGHLVLHRSVEAGEVEDPRRLKEIERDADRFASAFLMPRESFPHEVFTTRLDAFIDLKLRWKVSIQAMVYRCKQLELIDEDQFMNLYKSISYRKWRTKEPLDDPSRIPIEQPKLLAKATHLLLDAGRKAPDEICAEMRLAPTLIESFCNLTPGTLRASDETDEFDPQLR